MRVIVAKCSETAAEKISRAGGEVILPEPPKAVEASREG
jgi:ribosomal protein L18E